MLFNSLQFLAVRSVTAEIKSGFVSPKTFRVELYFEETEFLNESDALSNK